jgi:hypothetical protein
MAIVQPEYGPDLGQAILSGLGAYRKQKTFEREEGLVEERERAKALMGKPNLSPQEWNELYSINPQGAAARQQRESSISNQFAKERPVFALKIRNLPLDQKIAETRRRVEEVAKSGRNPADSQRLLAMLESGDPRQLQQVDAALDEAVKTGERMGIIKPLAAPKTDELGYRPATEAEKAAAGVTDPAPYQISLRGATKGKLSRIGSGQTINVKNLIGQGGQYKVGAIPPGYALTEKNGSPVFIKVKGGPAEEKAIETKKKEVLQKETTARTAGIVQEDIQRLTNLIEESPWYNPVTGISGAMAANIPGTARTDAEALKTSIGANIGFDRLQQMRDASKTGGALGAISEREMKQLESVMGSIDLSQSDAQLKRNLERLNKIYTNILKKANAYPDAEQFGFGAKAIPVKKDAVNQPTQEMPAEYRKRYY